MLLSSSEANKYYVLFFEILNLVGAGKSTTTAMLSVVLRSLGEDISAIVGAQVPQVFLENNHPP
jgi:UDP-N-acetylmuramate-alanine ligase